MLRWAGRKLAPTCPSERRTKGREETLAAHSYPTGYQTPRAVGSPMLLRTWPASSSLMSTSSVDDISCGIDAPPKTLL